jgi:uncharacterized damage-inducible protein DinB
MNDGLIDAFRHNAWASRKLLAICQELNEDQLQSTVSGTFGSINATLWHYISSEAGYYARLSGDEPDWDRRAEQAPSIRDLIRCNDDLESRWMRLLATPFDSERLHVVKWIRDEVRDVPAGVILTQAIHHGSEHRSQIATILTQLGIATPYWGLWEFAEETGRAPIHRER